MFCRWDAECRGPDIEIQVYSRNNLYIQFCKLCILGHSTVLCFLVVTSFIATNGDQLRISFIIWQTCHIFLQNLVKFQLYLGKGEGMTPAAPVLNTLLMIDIFKMSACGEQHIAFYVARFIIKISSTNFVFKYDLQR